MSVGVIFDKDMKIVNVLQYLMNCRHGYMRDLEKQTEPNIISELQRVGILKTGAASGGPTFALTTFGIQYCNIIGIGHQPLMCRLFNKMHGK